MNLLFDRITSVFSNKSRLSLVFAVFTFLASVNVAQGATEINRTKLENANLLFSKTQKITAQDGGPSDYFGLSVAISGNTAVVGAYNAKIGNNNGQGAAYVYVRNGLRWVLQQKLTAADGAFNDVFGSSVAISGDTIIVGAPLDNNQQNGRNHGSAYVFERTGSVWSQQQKILPADPNNEKEFGYSVAIRDDTAVVSARNDNGNFLYVSYVFERKNGSKWTEQQKLTASDGRPHTGFGFAIQIQKNTIFLGAVFAGDSAQGQVYVFTKKNDEWKESQIISAERGLRDDTFGNSLSVSGDTLVVGAGSADDINLPNRGAIYIFKRIGDVWTEQQKIFSPEPNYTNFAVSLASSNTFILVGANAAKLNRGTVYVYKREGSAWREYGEITPANTSKAASFGIDLSISGNRVIAGAYTDIIENNTNQGAAYAFDIGFPAPFDFDGDNRTDISVFRPGSGEWWYQRSSDGRVPAFEFGQPNDRPVPADFTGDGQTDIAFWRETSGEWFVLKSDDYTFYSFPFGTSGDVPVPADYDGDGRSDPAVFRSSSATWFVLNSNGGTTIRQFGLDGDAPIPHDFDGDGRSDLAVYRPTAAEWYYEQSSNMQVAGFQFGAVGNTVPVPGDYTGDGRVDIALFQPSTGEWFVLKSEDTSFFAFPFGSSGDIPVPGDYDGDGQTDAAVFRPSSNTWFLQQTTTGFQAVAFGAGGDVPLPAVSIP